MGGGRSVGGWCRHWEGGSVGGGWAEGECIEGGSEVQREDESVGGGWYSRRRGRQWVMILFHPPS